MELLTVNEVALYGVKLRELVEGPGQSSTLTLVPKILPDDALLNKSVPEIERMALEEAERVSPNYRRGKEVKRKGYARYRFLKGFRIVMVGREMRYELEWISVRLPVLYCEGRVRTQVEETLLREERKVFMALMAVYSVKGGKLNAKIWMPEIEIGGDFRYVIVDGKYVKLKRRKAVLLVAIGVTQEGRRAVLEVIVSEAEDTMAYWSLLVRVWKRSSFVLVVADGIQALDKAISLAELHVGRQGCLVHLKRRATKEEREALDAITSSAELGEIKPETNPTLLSYLVASKELWKWLKTNNLVESFNSLLERRRFGSFHSPWRILQIARAIALYYNLLTYFLTIVIILQSSSFLPIPQKYIQ
ncbi:IS256-like element ISC1250 family transposase [Saccharolobus solfataricus]|uniref:Transposase ISC1250 n=3 Tax=Saccharolobus solfataricus TaxID=2287 RepID=Q97YY6_SACS2|nr:IS256-like element ISC1250 family transposase [Saccharolobus solfataricus]AAK41414.1 Transposase ISC1250 [Saccharolobus solfataricus P2]AKA74355.1 IS256-like element ISC1250 family transposase [Saccharolobus solfataricus]AKA77051.1 IS256-like element ISC1250 family transposase [Saccharolobus solfataricus]AKA79743.1 IS256-like element ISC1250 family transposase [Saccharolobus solfataricus]AZF68838.1 IS256-like element ISC1250 family transposase [Saccharolobus solfataricus]